MLNSRSAFVAALVRAAFCAVVAASMALAQRPRPAARVTAVHLQPPVTAEYNGPCGSKLELRAIITTTGPGTVWFRFEVPRSMTIAGGEEGMMTFSSAGRGQLDKDATFTESRSGHFQVEAAMEIGGGRHAPAVVSNPVDYHFNCGGSAPAAKERLSSPNPPTRGPGPGVVNQATPPAGAQAGGQGRALARISQSSVTPTTWRGTCPHEFTFHAVIRSETPGEVHYTWLRSDDSQGKSETISLGAQQKREVSDTWTVGVDAGEHFRGWEQLKIDSPNTLTGPNIVFNLYCTK